MKRFASRNQTELPVLTALFRKSSARGTRRTKDAHQRLTDLMTQSLQDRYAPHGVCFSCGPKTDGDSVNVSGKLEVHGETTARMKGIFVAVGEHHPAFYSWH